jgi:hypothetical protein
VSSFRWKIGSRRRRSDPGFEEETGAGGKLAGIFFFGLFFGLGMLFLVLIARETWKGAETYAWDERRCEILVSEVVRGGGEAPYRPEVQFQTIDGGPDARGDAIHHSGNPGYGSHGKALARLAPYGAGATVPCYASAGGELVLERGPLAIGFFILLPLVFVGIGGAGLFAIFVPTRRNAEGAPAMKSLAAIAKKPGEGFWLARFGLLFAGIGLVATWFFAVVPLANFVAAKSWDAEACTVESSAVLSHRSDDGTTYSVDIFYHWDRGRGLERSSRYDFFFGATSGYEGKREIVGRHPRGAQAACWVHPQHTNEAVLERGLTPEAWFTPLPLLFVFAGLFMFRRGRTTSARRQRMRAQAQHGLGPFPADDPILDVLPAFEWGVPPVTLESESSRWARLAGSLLGTLFWNGIVSVFAHQVWQGHAKGDPDWLLTLFLMPFLLIGIALPFAVVHSLMVLRNARPRLVAGTRTPRLGERLELRWSLEGRTRALRRVQIRLVGCEKATYQVGTRSHTQEETFFDRAFVDLPAPSCTLGGQASIEIPSAAIHSLKAPHNEVVWELRFEGEIERWPDVKETYSLVVLPRADDPHKRERY